MKEMFKQECFITFSCIDTNTFELSHSTRVENHQQDLLWIHYYRKSNDVTEKYGRSLQFALVFQRKGQT